MRFLERLLSSSAILTAGKIKNMKIGRRFLAAFMAVVVFCTTYAMILPAITLDAATADAEPGIEAGLEGGESLSAAEGSSAALGVGSEDSRMGDSSAESAYDAYGAQEEAGVGSFDADPTGATEGESSAAAGTGNQTEAATGNGAGAETAAGSGAETDAAVNKRETDKQEIETETETRQQENAGVAQTLQASGADYTVTVVCSEESGVPAGAKLRVSEIKAGSAAYDDCLEEAREAITEETDAAVSSSHARFFDITILADGQEIEPEAGAKVQIRFRKPVSVDHLQEVSTVHFGEDGIELIDTEAQQTAKGVESVSFTADSFSIYGVLYTVDFHWEVDGKKFDYSIPGESAVLLADLLKLLNVVSDDPETQENEIDTFVADIDQVIFSEESLVKPIKTEKAISLQKLLKQLGFDTLAKNISEADELAEESDKLLSTYHTPAIPLDENSDGLLFGLPSYDTKEDAKEKQQEDTEPGIIHSQDIIPADTWILISLKPFETEETLTITLKDGEVFKIRVTDGQNGAWDVWFDGTLGQSGATGGYYSGAENRHVTANNSVTLPNNSNFRHPTGYDYVLAGWYMVNATNNETRYYDVSDTSKTVTVPISHDTVFYADWVPASYNKGPAAGKLLVGDTPSTAGFVTTEMFDYNELLNAALLGSPTSISINSQNHTETWTTSSDKFTFISWNYYNNPKYYTVGYPDDWNNMNLGNMNTYRGDTITTGLFNSALAERLFSQSNAIGKTYVGTGDRLFRYNSQTGEYYYDSDINAATYNQADGRFYVYQDKELIAGNDGSGLTNFLPYNDYPGGGVHQQNTGATNYWFGMKNTIQFYLPDDVGTAGGNQNKTNNSDMVFKFSGDDDVWVFVDDKLVLDLGGVHNRAGGEINFSTGEVTMFKGTINSRSNVVSSTDSNASTALKTMGANLSSIKEGNHTLTVYYLERGSSLSNCSIYFNLQPQPKSLDLSKRLVGLTESERAKYKDQVFTLELVVNGGLYNSPAKAATSDDYRAIWYDAAGNELKREIISNGQIKLKDGERVHIPHLNRFDTFYVAEQQGTNMDIFEEPHAERVYLEDGTNIGHEEELYLSPDHSQVENVQDWKTNQLELFDEEKVTFTNTLREKDLEVVKKWVDVPVSQQTPVTFTVKATIPGEGEGAAPVEVEVDEIKGKTFTLSSANHWTQLIEKLPAATNGGKPITYTVVEEENGFVSTVTSDEASLCDVDVVKYWPDEKHAYWADNPGHAAEVIRFKLKNGYGLYYAGENADPQFNNTGVWYELTETNGYTMRFRNLPASDDYTYYEPEDENTNTTGLSVFKRAIHATTITNTPMPSGKLTVTKIWKDAGGNVIDKPPAGTEMTYQIYRVSHVHEWSDWEVTTPPTETTQGVETRHCLHEGCSEVETRTLEVIGHNWVHDATKDQTVTCTQDGYEYWYCSNGCGAVEHRNVIPALGHDWDEGVVTKEAVWDSSNKKWIPGVITYTCRNDSSHTETKEYTPVNTFPGTDIPLQEDAIPKGEHDDNEQISVNPSGLFEYNGKYYIITSGGSLGNWAGIKGDVAQSIVNQGKAIQIDPNGTKYTPETFKSMPGYDAGGQKRDSMHKGDLYRAEDGTWYVFTLDTAGKEPSVDMSNWYKIPGTGPATSGDGTGVNTGNTPNPAPARRALKAKRNANENTYLQTTDAVNTKLEELRTRVGYTDGSGTVHYYYTVEALGTSDFSLTYEDQWTRTHEVDLKDENGNSYTYYVVETSPTTGWITSYSGEPINGYTGEALEGDGGQVTITNQLDQPKTANMKIIKVDQERKPLEDAKFILYDSSYDPEKTAAENVGCIISNNLISRKDSASATEAIIYTGELQAGTYYLVETDPPDGYLSPAGPIKIEVTIASGSISVKVTINGTELTYPDIQNSGNTWIIQVMNNAGYELPSTGGPGTNMLYICGIGLIALAASSLAMRRRRRSTR